MAEEARRLDPHFAALSKAFSADTFTDAEGYSLRYRLFSPAAEAGKTYPLVVFLHGAGERGTDNDLQVAGNRGAVVWTEPEEQAQRPCFVLAPQAEEGKSFTVPEFEKPFLRLLQKLLAEKPVDRERIYLTGLSMGGIGTWYYTARYPRIWAAAAPICGAGDPLAIPAAKHIPFWCFHAEDDPMVPVDGIIRREGQPARYGTRLMVAALRGCGGTVRYTEYPAGYIFARYDYPEFVAGHAAWEPAYSDGEFRRWLFQQDRRKQDRVTLIQPGVWQLDDYYGASYYLVEGDEAALVIDTGMGQHPILPRLRELTDKPLKLAVTHVHGDHMLHADEFDTVYFPKADRALLPEFQKRMMPDLQLREEALRDVEDGTVIELGNAAIQAVSCAGHTPGSMVYIDHRHRCIFTGDAIGSGTFVLLSVPGALCLSEYRRELEKLDAQAAARPDYAWFGGHSYQAAGSFDFSDFLPMSEQPETWNPLRRRVVQDMICLCTALLDGSAEKTELSFGEPNADDPSYLASVGAATMLVRRSQLC